MHTGLQLKDVAVATVLRNDANAQWKALAMEVIDLYARTGQKFTSEDVSANVHVIPEHSSIVGAVIAGARRSGKICAVGYAYAKRPKSRGALLRVWRGRESTEPSFASVVSAGLLRPSGAA
jgi:hypothetical protein